MRHLSGVADATRRHGYANPALKRRAKFIPPLRVETHRQICPQSFHTVSGPVLRLSRPVKYHALPVAQFSCWISVQMRVIKMTWCRKRRALFANCRINNGYLKALGLE